MRLMYLILFVSIQSFSQLPYYPDGAKQELKGRFEVGTYQYATGFPDDIQNIKTRSSEFVSDPDQYRPAFGSWTTSDQTATGETYVVYNDRQRMHLAALYAYAIDSVALANVVMDEIYATISANDLNSTFWQDYVTTPERVDDTHQGWIQALEVKKMMNDVLMLSDLQTSLTSLELTDIWDWIDDFGNIIYTTLYNRLPNYLGIDWELNGISEFRWNFEQISKLRDSNGDVIYTFAVAQDHFNNRNWDAVTFLHSWAVERSNTAVEFWCREFFKASLKYGLFPDGSWWELYRNDDASPAKGVQYGWTTLTAMIEMCHLDALAGSYPNDLLYDYTTTEGIVYGDDSITENGYDTTPSGYVGSSTTDGVTEKSLLTFLLGQTKYYRNSSYGGWNDLRYYEDTSDQTLTAVNPVLLGNSRPSTVALIPNFYYENEELYNYAIGNTSEGYPVKSTTSGGYMTSFPDSNDEMGALGNFITGAMWQGMDDYFFIPETTTSTISQLFDKVYFEGAEIEAIYNGSTLIYEKQ